jgi:hypothetical protein
MATNNILLFLMLSVGASGLGSLYLHLIKPMQLLSFMQKPLDYFKDKNVFMYKSLGGCKICTIQRFADVIFIAYALLTSLNIWLVLPLYCVFGGLVFYATSLTEKSVNPIVNSQKLEL